MHSSTEVWSHRNTLRSVLLLKSRCPVAFSCIRVVCIGLADVAQGPMENLYPHRVAAEGTGNTQGHIA